MILRSQSSLPERLNTQHSKHVFSNHKTLYKTYQTMSDSPAPASMQAVVCHGPRDYRLQSMPTPQISDAHEILCRVLTVGICAGDSKCHQGAAHFWSPGEYGLSYCEPPIIPGHEFVCEVVEMGDAAKRLYPDLAPADWCTAEQLIPCASCRYCLRDPTISGAVAAADTTRATPSYNMCMPHTIFGFRQKSPGAMAEYMIFPRGARVHKIPTSTSIPAAHWAYVEPLYVV